MSILTAEEFHELSVTFNNTDVKYPDDKSICRLFEVQANKRPDAPAIIFKKEKLTYAKLNSKANQLAHYLQSLGAISGTPVGICVKTSLEMFIGLLGILKAGCVYVPLDPKCPVERINFMLKDADVSFLITHKKLKGFDTDSVKTIHIDAELNIISSHSKKNLQTTNSLNRAAYIVYTSGSKGEPKGVIGTEKGIINRLNWMWKEYPFHKGEVCCQKAPINFMDHIAEIFSPLLKGIPLVVMPDELRSDLNGLINILAEKKVTRIVLVPSFLIGMLQCDPTQLARLSYMRYFFCSGEALPLNLIKPFFKYFNNARLFNIYGSTEVSADVAFFEVKPWKAVEEILKYFKPKLVNGLTEQYLDVSHRDVFTKPDVSLEKVIEKFRHSTLPEKSVRLEEYQDRFCKDVFPYIINTGCPTYIGHMTSALPDFIHELSKMISQLNQNLVKIETAKSLIFLEREAIAILHRFFYDFSNEFYDKNIQTVNKNLGLITTGGTTANISALLCARNIGLLRKEGTNELYKKSIYSVLEKKGYEDIVIIGTRLMHYSIDKASSLLGLGMDNIIHIDYDDNGFLDLAKLEEKINECRKNRLYILALIGIAGTTETGDIDPLSQMADIADKYKIYFHVDAAWSGPTIFSRKNKFKLNGIEKADSITICGHKQLYLPQGISICLFKNPDTLNLTATTARYQAMVDTFDSGRFSVEGSRSGLSVCLHAALHIIGQKGYEALIDNGIKKAEYFANLINTSDSFELLKKPCLNIVNYRYIPLRLRKKGKDNKLTKVDHLAINQINARIQAKEFHKGLTFVSKTSLYDTHYGKDVQIVVLRAVLSNPNTNNTDFYTVLTDQLKIADEIEKEENQHIDVFKEETLLFQVLDFLEAEALKIDNNYLEKNTIPIGRPIYNTQLYILDSHLNILPKGVKGELYVGGDSLAKEYLNRPELTREKFIPNPFIDDPDACLYKTGDLCRYLPDGNIEFLGRIDNQVKIRGYRIELEEIEAVLSKHEKVKQGVVLMRKDLIGNKQLVVYFTVNEKEKLPEPDELRAFLKTKLPDYMIPAEFVIQEFLPLMASGKIDRRSFSQKV